MKGVKVEQGHAKNCLMLSCGMQDNPMYISGQPVYRDAIGRRLRHGASGTPFIVFECNGGCGARVLIRYDLLTEFAHRLMVEAEGGTK